MSSTSVFQTMVNSQSIPMALTINTTIPNSYLNKNSRNVSNHLYKEKSIVKWRHKFGDICLLIPIYVYDFINYNMKIHCIPDLKRNKN